MPMTSQPSRARFLVRASAPARPGRAWQFGLHLASCLLLAQCSWLGPAPAPGPAPSGRTPARLPARTPWATRTLIKAADLPPPIGGGQGVVGCRPQRSVTRTMLFPSVRPSRAGRAGGAHRRSRAAKLPVSLIPPVIRPFPRDRRRLTVAGTAGYQVAFAIFSARSLRLRSKSAIEGWVSRPAVARR